MNPLKIKIETIIIFMILIISNISAAESFKLQQPIGKISLHEGYVDNMDQTWTIDIGSPKTIILNYSVSTEWGFDYIYIFEVGMNGEINNTPIAVLNGEANGSIRTNTPSGKVAMQFVSDGSVCYDCGYKGFDIIFMSSDSRISNNNIVAYDDISVGKNLIVVGKVGVGTGILDEKLTVEGDVVAQEIIVDLAVPADYVFKPDYRLRSLKEVDRFICQEGHLPEIKSATEIKNDGLKIGEMQNKLLQKIEELTLYVIQQQKRIDKLRTNLSSKFFDKK